jgi:hypothetical protein
MHSTMRLSLRANPMSPRSAAGTALTLTVVSALTGATIVMLATLAGNL